MFDAYKGLTIRNCPDGMSHVSNLKGSRHPTYNCPGGRLGWLAVAYETCPIVLRTQVAVSLVGCQGEAVEWGGLQGVTTTDVSCGDFNLVKVCPWGTTCGCSL